MSCSYDKKKWKEVADKRDNRTIHYYKGYKIECMSVLDYMGKSADDFTLEDIGKWKKYLDTFIPQKHRYNKQYNKVIFYCINVNDECYVGHTTNFSARIKQHKSCVNSLKNRLYIELYKIGFDNAVITILEERGCENIRDAVIHEQKHFDKIKATLNECPPLHPNKPNPYFIEKHT
tara:strand:- start:183 stop:710 length:528 start_codon:yes stop_codon:yes gene_type:complete